MLERLSLRLRVFLIFAALGLGAIALVAGGLAAGYSRLPDPDSAAALVQAGVIAGFGILGIVTLTWYLFDLNVAKPITGLAGSLRARTHADVVHEIDAREARYLGDLAPAAAAAALTLAETRNALAEAVARETARLTSEKSRLEALLSDVPVGVLLCSAEHQMVFYNGQAVDALGAGGLDRGLFEYLREAPVRHAYARLRDTADPDAASDLICATADGARILSARMRLVPTDAPEPGYVLTLRDVTADLAAQGRREALMTDVFDRLRRAAANLQTIVSAQSGSPEQSGDAGGASPLGSALSREVSALTQSVEGLSARREAERQDSPANIVLRASDLIDGLRARLGALGFAVEDRSDPILLRCNAFEIIGLMGALAAQVAATQGLTAFALSVTEDGPDAMLRLEWDGPSMPVGQMDRILGQSLGPDAAGASGRDVLAAHATEVWPEHASGGRAALCLPLALARRAVRRPKPIARAVVYDFDLLSKSRNSAIADTRLEDLTYVVFDSETTGLLPEKGDEMVQLAAVRIVNGRRVAGEVFNTLVNPGRPIPAGSTEVHGITDAMVADAPDVADVCRRFHRFAEGAVLVAHNAPFDMAFLRRREGELGLRFENPILDTVLLSAVVFGQHETHSLDALAHRLGLTIPEEARHTALGDTMATADALLKLLPMLQARDLRSFGDVLSEIRRHGRLLKDLN
jgi:DNA polymerase III subunit epsilon